MMAETIASLLTIFIIALHIVHSIPLIIIHRLDHYIAAVLKYIPGFPGITASQYLTRCNVRFRIKCAVVSF
jgi:hypothetical protein